MAKLVPPHGGGELKPLLLEGQALADEKKKAETLKKVPMTSRETSDLIMMGIGAFTPLDGFMGKDDWKGVCDNFQMPSMGSVFWPIPITLSAEQDLADSIEVGEEVALVDTETDTIMGTMKVTEKYQSDKTYEYYIRDDRAGRTRLIPSGAFPALGTDKPVERVIPLYVGHDGRAK